MGTKIKNIVMEFKKFRALDNVSLDIDNGEFIAILGPSGCGKTTLLRLIAGFNYPTSGEIYIGDKLVASNDYVLPANMRNISMVFQNYALWPHMSVYKNIEFPIKNSKFTPDYIRKDPSKRVAELLEMVGLAGLEKRMPGQLSGGQRQRVAVARALAIDPSLLLMDEPPSNLDTELRVEMRREINSLHQKTKSTILYVTHDQIEALSLADRIVVMNHGVIQQIDSPQNLYEHPKTEFVAKFVGRSNIISGEWEGDCFFPKGTTVSWNGENIANEFRQNGKYPVKPESLYILPEGMEGLPAVVTEVEYQGNEMRILLKLGDGTAAEIKQRGYDNIIPGNKVKLGIQNQL